MDFRLPVMILKSALPTFGILPVDPGGTTTPDPSTCNSRGPSGLICVDNIPQPAADQNSMKKIVSIVLVIAGSIALLMIVIGGFRYITAQGDPGKVAQARMTIIYSVLGLLVAMAAFSIVTLVVNGTA